MSISPEIEYSLGREAAERAAAAAATDAAACDAHVRMAERYADRVWSLTEKADPSHDGCG